MRVCRHHSTCSPRLVASTTVVGGLESVRPVLVSSLHGLGDPGVFLEKMRQGGGTVKQDDAGRSRFGGLSHLLADDVCLLVEQGC
jgi:hypothetical protein